MCNAALVRTRRPRMEIAQLAEHSSRALPAGNLGRIAGDAADPLERTLRLLIIDDEIRQDDALVRMLAFEGIDATTAYCGMVGLDYARAGGFDAILLDLKLPDVLGMT